jgi:hypothetical protein
LRCGISIIAGSSLRETQSLLLSSSDDSKSNYKASMIVMEPSDNHDFLQ